jgi:fermentation-respiration switch protein FrsA (DUF1100 family)
MASLLLYLIAFLVLVYAVWGLALLFLQSKLLYRPVREISLTPAELSLPCEDVAFRSADGVELTGWYVRAKNAPFTILLCHGNGGNISYLLDSLQLFHGLGLSCFAFDYRGYGRSTGRPTEAGTYLDAHAAYDWLTSVKGLGPDRIVLLGRSLGGSIAAHLAGRVPCGALAIESAFTSYLEVATGLYPYLPVRWFARFLYRYDTLAYLKDVRCPVLVIHSRDDGLLPFELGVRLFEAAREPKRFVELVGNHNAGFLLSGDTYKEAWRQWLDSLEDRGAPVAAHDS